MSKFEHFPKTTLFLGGTRSGKSLMAEELALFCDKHPVYLATAQIHDIEMQSRVTTHAARRSDKWQLIEEPLEVAEKLRGASGSEIVLIDCATLWLSNHMLAGADLDFAIMDLQQAIEQCAGNVVIVSNEVGMGIVPENALARQFRDAQGALNQGLAQLADLVVFVAAGLPMVLKGTLPNG